MNIYSEQDTLPHPCLQECAADAKYKEMTQRQPPTLLSLIGRPTKPNDPHPKIYALRRRKQQVLIMTSHTAPLAHGKFLKGENGR
jgi:hypothetical protein